MKYTYTPVYQIVKDGEVVDEWSDRKEAKGRAKAIGAKVQRVLKEEVVTESEFAPEEDPFCLPALTPGDVDETQFT